jgi:hypothetical protein
MDIFSIMSTDIVVRRTCSNNGLLGFNGVRWHLEKNLTLHLQYSEASLSAITLARVDHVELLNMNSWRTPLWMLGT